MQLSLVIPAYNEAAIISQTLTVVERYLNTLAIDYEIIVINDGSTDETLTKLNDYQSPRVKVLSYQINQGKGYAVNNGMRIARGEYVLMMDVDLSTDIKEIPVFLATMKESNCDIIIGNRNHQPFYQQQRPWGRALCGVGFAQLSATMLGCPLKDFTCGFKMFTQQAKEVITPRQRIHRWAFDSEMLFIAKQHHLTVSQLPVEWKHQGNSKVMVIKALGESFLELLRIRYFAFKGFYQ